MENIPLHVAVIPDGNRRWAKKRGLPIFEGHRLAAEKTLPKLLEKALKLGIKYFTFWALSTENLIGRTKKEIDALMQLMRYFLKNKAQELHKKNIKIKIIGNLNKLPIDIQEQIKKAEELTKDNKKMTLILAINYGGRDEIVRAVKKIRNWKLEIGNLDKESFSQLLDTKKIPDPDLIIRTGGEKRLSGFMPWQSEYSELYFSDVLFPDFSEVELEKALTEFTCRQRRYGK
jgi:undecaprenyl diphosphate synthase